MKKMTNEEFRKVQRTIANNHRRRERFESIGIQPRESYLYQGSWCRVICLSIRPAHVDIAVVKDDGCYRVNSVLADELVDPREGSAE